MARGPERLERGRRWWITTNEKFPSRAAKSTKNMNVCWKLQLHLLCEQGNGKKKNLTGYDLGCSSKLWDHFRVRLIPGPLTRRLNVLTEHLKGLWLEDCRFLITERFWNGRKLFCNRSFRRLEISHNHYHTHTHWCQNASFTLHKVKQRAFLPHHFLTDLIFHQQEQNWTTPKY